MVGTEKTDQLLQMDHSLKPLLPTGGSSVFTTGQVVEGKRKLQAPVGKLVWRMEWQWEADMPCFPSICFPPSWLPRPASLTLLKYSYTNAFWQPAIMRNNRPRVPQLCWAHTGEVGSGAISLKSPPSLSGQGSWQHHILEKWLLKLEVCS